MQATARMASVVSSTLPARRRLIRGVGAKESYEPETDYVDHDDRDRYGICNIPYQLPPVGTY